MSSLAVAHQAEPDDDQQRRTPTTTNDPAITVPCSRQLVLSSRQHSSYPPPRSVDVPPIARPVGGGYRVTSMRSTPLTRVNASRASGRAGELKSWRILREIRCCAHRATSLVRPPAARGAHPVLQVHAVDAIPRTPTGKAPLIVGPSANTPTRLRRQTAGWQSAGAERAAPGMLFRQP